MLFAAVTLTIVLVTALARFATSPTLELLFARLDPEDASRILSELESRGVRHELRGDTIYVDGAERDRLRLDFVAEGLPGTDGAGYELLDSLSGFGTTSQMFDAALNRAREGELARTLLAGSGVAAARVHIAVTPRSAFSRTVGATASVTLMMKSGDVPLELAQAAQSLVSGAVTGLAVDNVSVVDARTGRVVSSDASSRGLHERRGRLDEMKSAVDRILTARVGPGRFVAEVSLETSTEEELTRQRLLDPDTRVVISTETQESSSSGTEPAGQGVTVASNLPDGDGAEGGGNSQQQSADTRERVNFDISQTERQISRAAGSVERITAAVMVDGTVEVGGDGQEVWTPRSDEELAVLTELVQSAIGYREDRGDVVTVRSLRFEPVSADTIEVADEPFFSSAELTQLLTSGALAAVAVAILAFVVRPLLGSAAAVDRESESQLALTGGPENPSDVLPPPDTSLGQADLPSLDGPGAEDLPSLSDLPSLDSLDFSGADGNQSEEDPVDRLRQLISDRRDETMDVLKGWIEEDPEPKRAT